MRHGCLFVFVVLVSDRHCTRPDGARRGKVDACSLLTKEDAAAALGEAGHGAEVDADRRTVRRAASTRDQASTGCT